MVHKIAAPSLALQPPPVQPSFEHSTPQTNPFHHIESPTERQFSNTEPHTIKRVSDFTNEETGRRPSFHIDANGNKTGVAKPYPRDSMMEPLVYQLSKHIAPGLVPTTVNRVHQTGPGTIEPHSVQQYVEPHPDEAHYTDIRRHPDFPKIALLDYLTGNIDRHSGNVLHGKDDKLHAIDNGLAFDVQHEPEDIKNGNVENFADYSRIAKNLKHAATNKHDIPQDMRQNIANMHPEHYMPYFDQLHNHRFANTALSHSPLDWSEHGQQFHDRVKTLQNHFADPNVKNMGDLYARLYPGSNYAIQHGRQPAHGSPGFDGLGHRS
jgi:hypothetical protein